MPGQVRLGLDVFALTALLVAENPAISGIAAHEWAGAVLGTLLLVHVVVNWPWVTRTIVGFLGRVKSLSRVNLAVDAGLFLSIVSVTLSGVLVIPGFAASIGLQVSPAWHVLHLSSANLVVAFLILHVALHTRWVFRWVRETISPTPEVWVRVGNEVRRQPRTSPSTSDRNFHL